MHPTEARRTLPALGLLLALHACAGPVTSPPERPPAPPNVVLILLDDQGAGDLGLLGTDGLRTPNLDRLARSGVLFTQFYAAAPVCSPSRAALLTGKSPQAAGVPGNIAPIDGAGLPPEQITLAERFQDAGYRTALAGKWHLGHDALHNPAAQGFDRWFGHLGGCIDNWSHFFFWNGPNRHDLWLDGVEVHHDGAYFPDLMTDAALDVIGAEDERPFFLYFASNAPHYPYQGDSDRLAAARERGLPYPRDLYGAFLESIDARIGRLLAGIEAAGHGENTIVIYQSDHGHSTEVRAHGGGGTSGGLRGAKFSLFEGGVRVPAVIAWPGRIPAGERRAQVASSVDWVPTLADLCGLDLEPGATSGASLVPLLEDAESPSPHDALHWKQGKRWSVLAGNWKLLHDPVDNGSGPIPLPLAREDRLFLVNLIEDPGELDNLAGSHPERVAALTALHEAWIAGGH